MQTDSHSYYLRRAETELELAQRADHPRVVKAHYQMAAMYLDKVFGDGAPPTPQRTASGA